MEMKEGTAYIHIDSAAIQEMSKRVPILAVMWKEGKVHRGFRLRIDGPSEVVYSGHNREDMLCGKYHCWIETTSSVFVDGVLVPEEGIEPPTSSL